MTLHHRSTVLIGTLALAAGVAVAFAAFNWQTIAGWFASPPPPEKLTIAISDPFGSGLVHIAAAKGYFAVEGLDVTLQRHTSGRDALDAAIANRAGIAAVGDIPLMFAVTRNVPLYIVATISTSVDSEGILARRDHGVSATAQLKGKVIGVPLGTDAHFLLSVILAGHGMASGDVRTKNGKPEDLAAALSTGEIDAIAIWDPWLSRASRDAGANGVVIYPDKGYRFRFHLAGRREFVREHPAAMQKLIRALLRAEDHVQAQPQAARAMFIEDTKLDPALFDTIWPNYSLRITLSQGLLTVIEDQARWAIGSGLAEAREVPNFLESIYLDAMLAVKPQAVSIVR